jgi:hypothetical protein
MKWVRKEVKKETKEMRRRRTGKLNNERLKIPYIYMRSWNGKIVVSFTTFIYLSFVIIGFT